jgi:two-component system NtrC family sensor kinase
VKVLVVDDDLAVADVIAGMLEDLGCDVEVRDGVQPALDWLAEAPPPDLVISDIRMPGGRDGIDLAQAITRSHPTTPVVLVSGYSTHASDDLKWPLLFKPVSQSSLAEMLEQYRPVASSH